MVDRKQSRLGIAANAIAVGTILITLLAFSISFVPEDGSYAKRDAELAFFVCALVIAPILHAVGLIVGATGLFRSAKKAFAIVGIILNAVPLLFALAAWLLLVILVIFVIVKGPIWR